MLLSRGDEGCALVSSVQVWHLSWAAGAFPQRHPDGPRSLWGFLGVVSHFGNPDALPCPLWPVSHVRATWGMVRVEWGGCSQDEARPCTCM